MKIDIELESDRAVRQLNEKLPRKMIEVKQRTAMDIAEDAKIGLQNQLMKGNHSTTGTAYFMMDHLSVDVGERIVTGAEYIDDLVTGTNPHWPEKNIRFIQWAGLHGWNPDQLQQHISEEGTDPNPNFMENAMRFPKGMVKTRARRNIRRVLR